MRIADCDCKRRQRTANVVDIASAIIRLAATQVNKPTVLNERLGDSGVLSFQHVLSSHCILGLHQNIVHH